MRQLVHASLFSGFGAADLADEWDGATPSTVR